MGVRRVLRRIGNFFDLTDQDVPQEVITTPVQSTFEVGPHNHVDWLRYRATQAFTPGGMHTLVDALLDDTEQYCFQLHTFSWSLSVAAASVSYDLSVVDAVPGDLYWQSVWTSMPATFWAANKFGVWIGSGVRSSYTRASGIIVPPGFDLRFSWGDAGVGGTGHLAYILLKYPWGSRPLVLPGG